MWVIYNRFYRKLISDVLRHVRSPLMSTTVDDAFKLLQFYRLILRDKVSSRGRLLPTNPRIHMPQSPHATTTKLLPQKKPMCLEPVGSGQSDYTHYPYMMFKGQLYYPFLTTCNVCFKFLEKG